MTPIRVGTLVTAVDVIPTRLGRLPASLLGALLPQANGRDVLAWGARRLLYDRSADPYELSNVSAQHLEVTDPLAAALQLTLDA